MIIWSLRPPVGSCICMNSILMLLLLLHLALACFVKPWWSYDHQLLGNWLMYHACVSLMLSLVFVWHTGRCCCMLVLAQVTAIAWLLICFIYLWCFSEFYVWLGSCCDPSRLCLLEMVAPASSGCFCVLILVVFHRLLDYLMLKSYWTDNCPIFWWLCLLSGARWIWVTR
jgi:hypothetical protein